MKDVKKMSATRARLTKIGAVAVTAAIGVAAWTATASATPARPAAPVHTVSATAAYTPSGRVLSEGMTGTDVRAVQRRLAALKYYPGKVDGQYGTDTQAAIWAFQEVNHIKVTGVVDTATRKALQHPKAYKSASYKGKRANRIEVSQALEVLVLYKNNKIWFISHVSSGGGYYYNNGTAQAVTPNGTYNTDAYMPGWVTVPLGAMYNPVFFIGYEFAIHGDTYVPQGPASHGCVRIPMDAAAFFHKMVKTPGTQVHVYGKPQWEK
jgi:peptidoglycan hydrolase-like protein with peptidoglycan-binding domain